MKIKVDGVQLAFEAQGSGPVVLLLHAFPLSSSMWAAQMSAFGAQHRVVRMDVRGFGGSDPGKDPLTMDRIARDAAAVLDTVGASDAVLVGCSMGGYAAFAFARLFPSRLKGLVLADTKAAPDTEEGRAGRDALAQKVQGHGTKVAADTLLPKLLGQTTQRERPELVDRVRRLVLEARPHAIVNALHALRDRPDSRATLAQIQVPTLIVRGREDVVATAEEAEEMRAGIAGSRVVTLDGAGHLSSLEAPAAFDEAVRVFLRAL